MRARDTSPRDRLEESVEILDRWILDLLPVHPLPWRVNPGEVNNEVVDAKDVQVVTLPLGTQAETLIAMAETLHEELIAPLEKVFKRLDEEDCPGT